MKYKSQFIIGLLIILLLLSGCKGQDINQVGQDLENDIDNSSAHEPDYGGHMILPITKINSLNPLTINNESYFHLSKLIFESLFELDESFKPSRDLVESYLFIGDNLVSIKLKDNVYWHDGEKLTSEDIAFTINTIKYAGNESTYKKMWKEYAGSHNYASLSKIVNISIIDDLNLEIEFNQSVSNKLEVLTFPIIPKHRFVEGVENAQAYKRALEQENYTPIGTGPYKFVSHKKNKSIELEANENYWKGRPYISKITGRILDNEELALTAFEAGQVDLALPVDAEWERLDQNKNVRMVEFISQGYEFLAFNFGRGTTSQYGPGLRKAIAYGINRQAIIENVYLGHATQADLPIHPNSWMLSDNSNVYGYNVEKAKLELERMGWEDVDSDGYYEDENGRDVSLRLITNSYNPLRLKTADLIVENLNHIGIHVLKDYPDHVPDNLTEQAISQQWETVRGRITKGDFDIALIGLNLSPVPEISSLFHSNEIKTNSNFIRYKNENMDSALAQLSSANQNNRLESYEKVQSIILEDLPYVSLFFKNRALMISNKIKGEIDPTFYDIYRNIEKWYIPKNLQ